MRLVLATWQLAPLLRPGTALAVKGKDTVRGHNQRGIINGFCADDFLARLSAQTAPAGRIGTDTGKAINCGLYYSAVGLLRTVTELYADQIGRWPQVIVTGGAAEVIKKDCDFVDSWVPNLPVRGIVLTYKKYLEDQGHFAEVQTKPRKKK